MSGHLALAFTVRGDVRPSQHAAWSTDASVVLDAGEEVKRLVGALRDLFRTY